MRKKPIESTLNSSGNCLKKHRAGRTREDPWTSSSTTKATVALSSILAAGTREDSRPPPAASYTEVRCMSMEIPGYLPSHPVFDGTSRTDRIHRTQGRVEVDLGDVRPNREQLEEMARKLQTATESIDKRLKFSVNQDLNRIVVKVVDANTDKVIKELPPDSLQRIQVRLREAIGLLLDEQI